MIRLAELVVLGQKAQVSDSRAIMALLLSYCPLFIFILEFCPVHISKTILAMAMKFRGWLQLDVRRAYFATICSSC